MLTCSLAIDGLCGLPATQLLVVQKHGGTASAFPRCGIHDPHGYISLLGRTDPDAVIVVMPLQLPAVA